MLLNYPIRLNKRFIYSQNNNNLCRKGPLEIIWFNPPISNHYERYLGSQNPFLDLCICVQIAIYGKNEKQSKLIH